MTEREFVLQIRRSLIQIVKLLKNGKPVGEALLISLPAVIKALERFYHIECEVSEVSVAETESRT
jgi:hypothetical protein